MKKARALALSLLFISHCLAVFMPAPIPPHDESWRPLCNNQLALANYACTVLLPQSSLPSQQSGFLPDHDGHNRHYHDGELTAQENCCKWLNNVNDVCLCDLLVHLPPFLVRSIHNYTIVIGDTCNVTYSCGRSSVPRIHRP